MEGEHLSIKESRKLTGVTTQTLRNWAIKNKVRFTETPTGRKLYNKQDILSIINMPKLQLQKEKRKIAYCRVSSKKQSDDLERQKEFFRREYPEYHLVEDIGSGINWNKKGLKTILEQAMSGAIGEVMVAYRDRLCRFAFELIEFIFEKNGVKLTVLNSDTTNTKNTTNTTESNIDNELSEDIMSIVHVYSCRKMGRRRYKKNSDEIKETSNLSE